MSHRYLILGLLAESPMTGYDIRKHVRAFLSAATSASYGTLYPMLHRLLKHGAVQVEEVSQKGRPPKKVYHITGLGRDELADWLKRPAEADQVRREFLLKLYLAKDLPMKDMLAILESRRKSIAAHLKTLLQEKQTASTARQRWIVEYAVSICRAEMDWLQRIQSQIGIM